MDHLLSLYLISLKTRRSINIKRRASVIAGDHALLVFHFLCRLYGLYIRIHAPFSRVSRNGLRHSTKFRLSDAQISSGFCCDHSRVTLLPGVDALLRATAEQSLVQIDLVKSHQLMFQCDILQGHISLVLFTLYLALLIVQTCLLNLLPPVVNSHEIALSLLEPLTLLIPHRFLGLWPANLIVGSHNAQL